MRDIKTVFKDLVKKPPLLFPLVALFHLFLVCYTVWLMHDAPLISPEYLQVLVILLYTIFWIMICDMSKVGALGYLAITSINLIVMFALKHYINPGIYTNNLFPADVLFSFFILFYYKQFD